MNAEPFKLLLVEDNPGDARLVQAALADHAPGEFAITHAERLTDALARIGDERFDAALCDLGLPDSSGLATVRAMASHAAALPLVVLTGSHHQNIGREAIRHGAEDYLVKGQADGALIARTLRYAIERKRLENERRELNETLERRVTERTLALSRQKNLYAMLSQTNEAIVRGASEDELFQAVCRIAVEHGRFRFAWIGLLEPDGQSLEPVAQFGDDAGYVNEVRISANERAPGGRGIIGQVLRTGSRGYTNDMFAGGRQLDWREIARRAGVCAVASLPIRGGNAVIGVISVYSSESGFFTEDLLATLDEMAIDVSFALDNLEREAERRRVTEALREAEERLEYAVRGSQAAIWDRDLVRNRYYRSSRLDEMLGYAQGEIESTREGFFALVHPEDLARIEQVEQRRIAEPGVSHGVEFRMRRKDGSYLWCLSTGRATLDADRRQVRISGSVVDVDERKRAERALAESEERFRGLVEQSIAGIYIVQDGKYAYVNPRFAEIRGYDSAEELIGRDVFSTSLIAAQDREWVAESVRRLLAGEAQHVNYTFTAVRKDGSTVEVGVHGARATYKDRPAVIGLMQDISEKKRAEEQIQRYLAQLETAFMSSVTVAMTLSEMRDPYTAGHERRVAEIAVAIAGELGFDDRRLEGLRVAGYLHDIGKITVPSEILSKPGKLTAVEFALIKGHAQAGYDVLKKVEFPWPVAEVALQHHERLDGRGYPQGLKGEAIVLEARIMAVADVIEAIASHRPYRAGLGIDKALAEIERRRGSAYDPVVADACLKLFREKGYAIPA